MEHVDSDGDGLLDSNEFRSLAAIVRYDTLTYLLQTVSCLIDPQIKLSHRGWGDGPSEPYIQSLYNCTAHNATRGGMFVIHTPSSDPDNSTTERQPLQAVSPTVAEALNCTAISEGITRNVDWARLHPTHILGSEKDVAFEMVGDNATATRAQLDSVRARQSKFICINDNIQNSTPELDAILNDFFESFFPTPDIFELPEGESNPTQYLDEYQQRRRHIRLLGLGAEHTPVALVTVVIAAAVVAYRLLAVRRKFSSKY